MNQPLRIGLVGAGMVSRHHLAQTSESDQACLRAISNLETLRLVEDCYRLSGWEALR
jgi:predicted dehydrogenase